MNNWKRVLTVLVILTLLFIVLRNAINNKSSKEDLKVKDVVEGVRVTDVISESADTLVVLVHAFRNSSEDMNEIEKVVVDSLEGSEVDTWKVNYNANMLVNTDLELIAESINVKIQDIVEEKENTEKEYKEIILIGHSIGALLVRKTYLYSFLDKSSTRPGLGGNTNWHNKVERIILFAGINRGWTIKKMKFLDRIKTRLAKPVVKFLGLGEMVLSAEQGSPFVTNLQFEWLNASKDDEFKVRVIQLLGKEDRRVNFEDDEVLLSTINYIFIQIENANHSNVIKLLEFSDGRKEKFIEALKSPFYKLETNYKHNYGNHLDEKYPGRNEIKHVIFIVHGIRDWGGWTRNLANKIKTTENSSKIIVEEKGYGYFSMFKFLLFGNREKNVKWFADQYILKKAIYPNAKFSFIGHSNGTYILASSLENYFGIEFDSVYFAGSVVRNDFPWDDYVGENKRVTNFRNDIAIGDFVVAFFPKAFYKTRLNDDPEYKGFLNLGSGGYDGFLDNTAKKNVKYFKGGHGRALNSDNHESIINFILEGNMEDTEVIKSEGLYLKVIEIFSRIPWLIWFLLILLINKIRKLMLNLFKNKYSEKKINIIFFIFILILLNNF